MPLPIAETWFETRTYSDDITLIFEPHDIPDIRCNMWHVRGRDHDLLFDSGMGLISLKCHVALIAQAFRAPSPPAAIDRIARSQWVERAN